MAVSLQKGENSPSDGPKLMAWSISVQCFNASLNIATQHGTQYLVVKYELKGSDYYQKQV